jgi:DNA invertase Pin-like site-specific DNA recombinase
MKPRKGTVQLRSAVRRCAIYTRKSSEEGLEQAFNSLDAQREACEAYITSQRHEGWVALPTLYDDGGISGGTMERPALQQLLVDLKGARTITVKITRNPLSRVGGTHRADTRLPLDWAEQRRVLGFS